MELVCWQIVVTGRLSVVPDQSVHSEQVSAQFVESVSALWQLVLSVEQSL